MQSLDDTIQKLLTHPYFEKAKHVKEINPGHPEDSVYEHLVQTADFLKQHRGGEFISNSQARNSFQNFMKQETDGVPFGDIAVLAGLVHDIGKILSFREGDKITPINQPKPNSDQTYSPHHGYWGAETIVRPLLGDVGVNGKVADYITDIVRVHLVPFNYYKLSGGFAIKDAVADLKPWLEGLHVEVVFVAYADVAYNPRMRDCWELMGKMLDEPDLYLRREYFVE